MTEKNKKTLNKAAKNTAIADKKVNELSGVEQNTPKKSIRKTVKKEPKKKVSSRVAMFKLLESTSKSYDRRSVGKPTKYNSKFSAMMLAYFDMYVSNDYKNDPEGTFYIDVNMLTNQRELKAYKFPTFQRIASILGVSYESMREWYTKKSDKDDSKYMYPEYRQTYDLCKTIQDAILIEGGITGALRGGFLNLAAKNLLGWQDKIEQEVSYGGTEEMFALLAKNSERLALQTGRYQEIIGQRKSSLDKKKKALEEGNL